MRKQSIFVNNGCFVSIFLLPNYLIPLPIKDVFRTLDWGRIKEELGLIDNLMQLADGFN